MPRVLRYIKEASVTAAEGTKKQPGADHNFPFASPDLSLSPLHPVWSHKKADMYGLHQQASLLTSFQRGLAGKQRGSCRGEIQRQENSEVRKFIPLAPSLLGCCLLTLSFYQRPLLLSGIPEYKSPPLGSCNW